MPLQPDVEALISARPAIPSIQTIPIDEYRQLLNARTAATPPYDVPLAGVTDKRIELADRSLPIRVYKPTGTAPYPIVLYFHGGGFVIGNLDISDAICRAMCSQTGAIVVSVDYRLAPEHAFPAANDDAYDALLWLAANMSELGGNGIVAVAGDSAGANLSAALCLRARDEGFDLAAQALMYPAPDYPDLDLPSYRDLADAPMITTQDALFFWDLYLDGDRAPIDPQAVPAKARSHEGLPSAFVATAELDPTRDGGEAYARILTNAGVPTVAKRYSGMPHGFFNLVPYAPSVQRAMTELCDWLKPALALGSPLRL